MMKVLALSLLSWSFAASAASATKGFVKIRQGHEVYAEYFAPRPGRPTVVLVNGLVYDLKRWDPYTRELTAAGVGVVRYNFRGQSQTLLREAELSKTPAFFENGLSPADFAQELSQTIAEIGVRGKVAVVGLSYGAAIAAEFTHRYPQQVEDLILMAPLVVSLDRYDAMGAWIRWNLDAIRFWWGPFWGPAAYDYYYDMIFRSFLVDQRITKDRIPQDVAAIPEIYKESVFHQVRAMRDFDLKSYSFKGSRVHLMVASEEDAPAFADQLAAWKAWDKDARASLIYIDKASHAIPDAAPATAADLTLQVLEGRKDLREGRIYRAQDGRRLECKDVSSLKSGTCE